jgi:hypothetical protein
MCASQMLGFILRDRAYGEAIFDSHRGIVILTPIDLIDVYGLDEPLIAKRAIESLVIASESKNTIKAIAKTYTDRDDRRFWANFVHGKGAGQIILLHGPPGNGTSERAYPV